MIPPLRRSAASPVPAYPAVIETTPNGLFGVYFPDLPGCTAMGDTREKAIRTAKSALRDWIEETRLQGEEVPKPSDIAAAADEATEIGAEAIMIAIEGHG